MNGKDLFNGMSFVEERLVNEAETDRPECVRTPWKRWTAFAACLCILIAGAVYGWDHLLFHPHIGDTAGSADNALAQDSENVQVSQETSRLEPAGSMPGGNGLGEVPSVILRVDSVTETGFIGTVAEFVDTDVIPIGTSLKVVITDDTHSDLKKEEFMPVEDVSGDSVTMVGSLICVQFVEYDMESGTIYVNMISPADN